MRDRRLAHIQEQATVSEQCVPLIGECCIQTAKMAVATLRKGYKYQQDATGDSALKTDILTQRSQQYLSEMYYAASHEMASIVMMMLERSPKPRKRKQVMAPYIDASARYLADVAALYKSKDKATKGGKRWKRWF